MRNSEIMFPAPPGDQNIKVFAFVKFMLQWETDNKDKKNIYSPADS